MNFLKSLYNNSPGFVKNIFIKVYQNIKGPLFKQPEFLMWHNFLKESQYWGLEKIKEYQMQQLSKLLSHAYANVPYYKKLFDNNGFKPEDIKNLNDFANKMPLLTKDTIRENFNDFVASNISKNDMYYVTTGGTSGKPLGLYLDKKTGFAQAAFNWREWNWMGYEFGDKCLVLRGNVIKRKENGRLAWWEYIKANNCLILSTYDMTGENLVKYAKKIEEFRPKIIRGYPSALEVLAKYIKENSLKVNANGEIKAIATSSENLFPVQRKLIEEVFKCPIFDYYGNCEQTTILGECEKHAGYHDFAEHSYTEILNESGNSVEGQNEIGEIVSTGFTNYAFPLIRYKTEDFGIRADKVCSCGRELPLLKEIKGRWYQERILTKNGSSISITAVNSHSAMFDNVKQFQYYQDSLDKLILRIIKKETYTDKDTDVILKELKIKLENQINIEIQFLSEIPRTDRGKYKFLVQKLPTENYVKN